MTSSTGATDQVWLTSYVIDELYCQMCEGPIVDHKCNIGTCGKEKMSHHYVEAQTYARRISYGNFEGKNAEHKPKFIINGINFTPNLKQELRIANDAKTLHRIVTESVFRIFRSRHRHIFYEHIEPHKLNWRIINL